jgi:biopolymer transport protein ExbD
MAHSPNLDSIKAEPNLVPLLDLVFQLIMFFMICVNFVSEQVNSDIKLPVAQSARPMDKGEIDVLFLNMDSSGKLIVSGQPKPLSSPGEKRYYLKQQYEDAKRAAQERGDKRAR